MMCELLGDGGNASNLVKQKERDILASGTHERWGVDIYLEHPKLRPLARC